MPGPIEEHLAATISRELAAAGLADPAVEIQSAEAENWRFHVAAGGRAFEAGFDHREQLWIREVTAGAERSLVSNDEGRIGTSDAARTAAVRRIQRALSHPESVRRDPPII